ncbi:OmpA family protein [Granulosicoccus sp. 3-233]|uniref:OmpA family protein n=1 Tax=Granulosicoccus sp. 3-233 TaxID=3417969 RepID=UPI003D3272CD
MKKLLVLALLGLILGAGAWKVQNPDGTFDDARSQAVALGERLNSGVQAVLQPGQTDTQAQQQTLEERLALLEESIVADSSDNLPTAVNELTEVAQDAEAGNAANVVRLDAIDSRLALLVRRIDEQAVEQGLQQIRDTVDTLTEDVASLRQSSDDREASVSSELATVKEQITALDLRLDTLAATPIAATSEGDVDATGSPGLAATLDERFRALESRLSTANSDSRRIATLSEQLAAAREEISQLQQSTASNRRNVNRLDGSVTQLRTAGESLSIDAVQAEISDQLALVQSQVDSSGAIGNTAALQGLLDNIRKRIEELGTRVQELPASSPEAGNAQDMQSTLESRMVSLDERLQEIGGANPDLADTLSSVQQKVDQLASSDFVTRDDLREQTEPQAVQYKIYFDRNSVQITDAAATVLDSFITQEKNRTTGVSIFGFTDRLGSATYNQQLALQRATNVRSYLIQNGFDYTKIKALNGLGEDAAAAVLPDNADDAQQRVVVLYATQP